MKKILVVSVVVSLALSVNAQFVYDYLKSADDYYKKGDYYSAAQYYEKYLGIDKSKDKPDFTPYTPQPGSKKKVTSATSKEQAIWNLAESYRLLNFPEKAETYYKQAMDMGEGKFPLAEYYHATMLRALGQYESAETEFKNFLSSYSTDDEYKKGAERELLNLAFIQKQLKKKDLRYYTVTKAPADLNTKGASYAPVWLNSNTLMFTSTRPQDSTEKKKDYTNRVYQALYSEGTLTEIQKTKMPQSKDIHQGVVSLTPDGNTIFLTRWTVTGEKKKSAIYSSTKTSDGWSTPEMLDETINTSGANTQQPFVTPDGQYLIFASDRAGGKGGFDLWYAPLDANGKPGTPLNIGDVINTSYDEQAPFYHAASGSLIFSSNGRVGMGGYDFFQSKGTIGNFAEPVNFGYPVNSVKDDIYFTSRGGAKNILEDVMLSSDRDASCCLELFYLKKMRPLKQLSGRIVSCDATKPLTGATVIITDVTTGKTVFTGPVNADGSYSFTMEDFTLTRLKAEAKGFVPNSKDVNSPADDEEIEFAYPDLCLEPIIPQVNETFVIENVYYEFNKSNLTPESYPALDEVARMLNTYPNMVIEIGGHTDNIGTDKYNQKLSEARAKSVVAYLVGKGIDPSRLQAKGYGESMPIEPNKNTDGTDNPAGREKNRRTEFKVLEN